MERLRGRGRRLFGSYEAGCAHECWQMDGKGPFRVRLLGGEIVAVHVLSVLDDHSRAVLAAIVAAAEDTAAAIAVFQKAALRYGLPDRMQFDRGSAFDSDAFRSGLAQCGVHRNHVHARQPTAQGKIEAYHRPLSRWFIDELAAQQVVDLEHLRRRAGACSNSRSPGVLGRRWLGAGAERTAAGGRCSRPAATHSYRNFRVQALESLAP